MPDPGERRVEVFPSSSPLAWQAGYLGLHLHAYGDRTVHECRCRRSQLAITENVWHVQCHSSGWVLGSRS
eukprot:7891145-Alexandrium_andersonii.AAC.1